MSSYDIPALLRANELLDFLSGREASFVEIVEALNLPRSSVYSLIKTLEKIGFIRKVQNGKSYALGFKLFELGSLAVGKVNLRTEAQDILKALVAETNLTCHLGCLDEYGAFYLVKIQPSNSLLVNSWEGKRASLTGSGLGKSLLAFQNTKDRARYLGLIEKRAAGWGKFPNKKEFIKALDFYRERGWAIDDGEDSPHIRCVAAPIYDAGGRVTSSVSVTGPKDDLPETRLNSLAESVISAARRISLRLGAAPA